MDDAERFRSYGELLNELRGKLDEVKNLAVGAGLHERWGETVYLLEGARVVSCEVLLFSDRPGLILELTGSLLRPVDTGPFPSPGSIGPVLAALESVRSAMITVRFSDKIFVKGWSEDGRSIEAMPYWSDDGRAVAFANRAFAGGEYREIEIGYPSVPGKLGVSFSYSPSFDRAGGEDALAYLSEFDGGMELQPSSDCSSSHVPLERCSEGDRAGGKPVLHVPVRPGGGCEDNRPSIEEWLRELSRHSEQLRLRKVEEAVFALLDELSGVVAAEGEMGGERRQKLLALKQRRGAGLPRGGSKIMSSATQMIEERTRMCIEKVEPALDTYEALSRKYFERAEYAREVGRTRHAMHNEMFRLIVLGHFKTGKSTLINTLLGRATCPLDGLADGHSPIPTNDLPTTAILTSIEYSESPLVKVLYKDEFHKSRGEEELWSFDRYLKDSKVKPRREDNEDFFKPIREFRMGFPAELCRAGVTLIDSPGTNDAPERDFITMQAAQSADAAIAVFRSDVLAGMSEQMFVQELQMLGLTNLFYLVNVWNGRQIDEELKAVTWDKLVTQMQEGPSYEGQDPATANIFFVDVRKALRGKMESDSGLLEESGAAHFEERLRLFLEKDRRSVHMRRFVNQAKFYAARIEKEIRKRIPALSMDHQQLHYRFEMIRPKLEEIRVRQKRVPKIIEDYREKTRFSVRAGFDKLVNDVVAGLQPGGRTHEAIRAIKIPALHKSDMKEDILMRFKAPFARKKLGREASELAAQVIDGYVKAWINTSDGEDGLRAILTNRITSMLEEIEAEAARIQRELDEVEFDMTGVYSTVGRDADYGKPGWSGRVVGVLWGAVTMSPDLAYTGYTGGWRGLGRDMLGRLLVTSAVLATATGPIGLPAAALIALGGLVMNLIMGTGGLERDILKGIIEYMQKGNVKEGGKGCLRDALSENWPRLEECVDKYFDRLVGVVSREVKLAMDEEEAGYLGLLEQSRMEMEQKQELLKEMERDLKRIAESMPGLEEALDAAQQL